MAYRAKSVQRPSFHLAPAAFLPSCLSPSPQMPQVSPHQTPLLELGLGIRQGPWGSRVSWVSVGHMR